MIDLRNEENARDEKVTGSRNRLMRLVSQKDDEETEGRVEIRHHRPMEFFSLQPGESATTGIEYWVVNHYRKSKKRNSSKNEQTFLRFHVFSFSKKNSQSGEALRLRVSFF